MHAAEVTLQKGFAFYVELERKDQVGTQFSFPLSDLLIKCLKSKPDGGNVMDAAFVQQSIREKYKLAK